MPLERWPQLPRSLPYEGRSVLYARWLSFTALGNELAALATPTVTVHFRSAATSHGADENRQGDQVHATVEFGFLEQALYV